jgi:o-succinylbenzoate---CoA ligase
VEWNVPVYPDWIEGRAAINPDRVALTADGRAWTFAQLDTDVTRMARRLAGLGVEAGDRVATLLNNGATAAIFPHALLRLGATVVPLNTRLSQPEIEWQLSDASPRLVIVEKRTASLVTSTTTTTVIDAADLGSASEAVVDLRLEHDADAILAIIYTSGTTGRPKGAMLTVANFWWSATGSALNLGTRDDDRWIACLPLFHVGGLSIVMRSAIFGTTAVVQDGFDAAAVNEEIDSGATIVSVVSVMLDRMIDERNGRRYPATLRCVLLGGGPAPAALLDRCIALGIPVAQTYGLTETCSQAATLAPEDAQRKFGSAGKPLHPNEIVVDDAGEILVRGPIVMAGYLNNPEATARALTDGWLHTGDIGRIDSDGYLYVLDRRDDLIITGGENVYPAEVEAVLLAHHSVTEAGVIGVADEKWGQRVVAVVNLTVPIDAEELAEYCRLRLAGYKVPKEFRFTSEPLPRTASGKIRRVALRDIVANLESS